MNSLPITSIAIVGVWALPLAIVAGVVVERSRGTAALTLVPGRSLLLSLSILLGGLVVLGVVLPGSTDPILVLLVQLIAVWVLLRGDFQSLPLPRSGRAWLGSFGVGLSGAVALFGLLVLAVRILMAVAPTITLPSLPASTGHWQQQLLPVVLAALILPFLEEVIFRMGVVGWLIPRVGPAAAVLIGAALFSAMHLDSSLFAARFAGGVAMGWVYVRRRDLAAPFALHALTNIGIMYVPWLWNFMEGHLNR